MNPKEGTNAHIIGTRGHLFWDTEISVATPDTGLIDGEDSKVGGLDLGDVAFVGNTEGAALDVA